MSYQTLRPQLATLLGTASLLQEVSGTPMQKFEGYPAAYVVPSNNANDYETNRENERVYAFQVRLFEETKSGGVSNAITRLEKVVDQVLDLIDQEDQKGATDRVVGVSMPASYTWLNIFAVPSFWAELPDEGLVFTELTVRIRVSVDVT